MENTWAAKRLLQHCLQGVPWTDELLLAALNEDNGRAFFRVVVERLGDLFELRLCDVYARLFARAIELTRGDLKAADLIARYDAIRQPRVCADDPQTVFVLSRVTLGADVAVTSILLDAAKKRFPKAKIQLVGPRKNWELFAADPRIEHHEFTYPRHGTLAERFRTWPDLSTPGSIVIDPDSRLSQLGLLPVCDDKFYYFFESRAYGGDSEETLVSLTKRWAAETFGIHDAKAYTAPAPSDIQADVAISFGVGENAEKRIDDPFEEELLRMISAQGAQIVIDEGAGGEERDRIRCLCARLPQVRSWSGAYAPFADAICRAKLFVGYDSAGQHVAAAAGTPLISIFAGYPSDRMFQRWRPDGPGPINVLKVEDRNPALVLRTISQYLTL